MDPNQNQTQQPMLGQAPPAPAPAPMAPQPAQPMPNAQPQYATAQPQPGYQAPPAPAPMPVGPGVAAPGGRVAPKATPAMFRGVTASVFCECPSCGQSTHTRVETENSPMQWILCIIMFVVGLWCCCCIPFCIDSLKGGNHYCTNCGSSIGIIHQ